MLSFSNCLTVTRGHLEPLWVQCGAREPAAQGECRVPARMADGTIPLCIIVCSASSPLSTPYSPLCSGLGSPPRSGREILGNYGGMGRQRMPEVTAFAALLPPCLLPRFGFDVPLSFISWSCRRLGSGSETGKGRWLEVMKYPPAR